MLALLIFPMLWLQVPAAVFSVLLALSRSSQHMHCLLPPRALLCLARSRSLTFKPTCTLDDSFSTSSPSSIHAYGITLSMHNSGSSSCRSDVEHAQQVNHVFIRRTCPLCSTRTDTQTDTRSDELRRTIKRSLTLAPNNRKVGRVSYSTIVQCNSSYDCYIL